MSDPNIFKSRGVQLALLTALISGVAVFANSFAVKAFKDPFVFTTLKNVLVALALTGLFSVSLLRRQLTALNRRQWLQLGLIGLIGGSVPFLLFFKGVSLMPMPVMAAFIHKTLFIWVALLALPLLKEKLGRIQWIALAVLLLGTYCLGGPRVWHWGTGEWLVLAATWLWAIESIFAKRILRNLSAEIVAWGRMALGSILLLAFLGVTGRISGLIELDTKQWSWSLVSLILLTGYVLTWFHALKRAPVTAVTSVLVIAAPITALLTSLFISHRIGRLELVAAFLITVAIWMILRATRLKSKDSTSIHDLVSPSPANQEFHKGIIECSRYAFKPNELGYCGPDDSAGLFELTIQQKRTRGYEQLLGGFETLYPYLTFIARNIGARDPFDSRVVETYWLGAPASQRLSLDGFYDHFAEGLNLKKKLPQSVLEHLVGKIPQGARPNHNFHVLNVFTRTGHLSQPHTLETMDQCRISWGVVQSVDHHKGEAVVHRQKLESVNGQLALAESAPEIVKYIWQGGTFMADLQIGDTVSIHWSWICARLAPLEADWIKRSTLEAIRFHNQSK